MFVVVALSVINICYLPAGGRIEKDFALVLSTTRGRFKAERKGFLDTDRPKQANNVFIYFFLF